MARLIDADALLENQPKGCYRTSDWINAAPTVPAIPVEWLKGLMLSTEDDVDEVEFAWIMREWQKEQEAR